MGPADGFEQFLRSGLVRGRHRRADGTMFPVEVSVRMVVEGLEPRLVAVARDITEIVEQQSSLEELNHELEQRVDERTAELLEHQQARAETERLQAVGRMAAAVAHDFKNLLTVYEMAASELRHGSADAEIVDDVQEATEHGREPVQSLLDFSRDRQRPQRRVDTPVVVRTAAGFARRTLGPDVELRLDIGPAEAVRLDPAELERVLVNLIQNSQSAQATGIDLRLRSRSGQVELTIVDDGRGMAPEVEERCLDPFFSGGEGTGLGLATVASIVRGWDGELVIATAEGQGTTVTIRLPVDAV